MVDRRTFLGQSTAAGTVLAAMSPLEAALGSTGVVKKPRVGVIGCGWFGLLNLQRLTDVAPIEVVALCDPDTKHLDEGIAQVAKAGQTERPALFKDFREMLKPKNLDIVIVGTPDHWHALPMIAAVEAGADVYVEKPISHTIDEGKAMVAAAKRTGRVVQVGMQRRSTAHIAQARTFISEGHLGKIGVVRAYCYYNMRGAENPPDTAPPKTLDYDLWLGPAPELPYNPLMHPKGWRRFMEFGNGILGDMGVHMLDVARWCLGLGYPRRVYSTGGIFVKKGKSNITDTQTVTYDYDELSMIWEHRTWGRSDDDRYGWGVNFYGERGLLRLSIDSWDFQPFGAGAAVHRDVERDQNGDNIARANQAHMRNFLQAIADRSEPVANITEGHMSAVLCQLGTISQTLGRAVEWDAATGKIRADDAANQLLRRPYRAGWTFPEVV